MTGANGSPGDRGKDGAAGNQGPAGSPVNQDLYISK